MDHRNDVCRTAEAPSSHPNINTTDTDTNGVENEYDASCSVNHAAPSGLGQLQSSFVQQPPPSSSQPSSVNPNYRREAANDQGILNATIPITPCITSIDAYECRIEELGQLMQEQGRCLDELTDRSRRLSTENIMLRERLSSGIENLVSKPNHHSSYPDSVDKSPLQNITNNNPKKNSIGSAFTSDEDAKLVQKCGDQNDLLLQQSDLLAKELMDANERIAERDASIALLGKELSACLEKARTCKLQREGYFPLSFYIFIKTLCMHSYRSDKLRNGLTSNTISSHVL